MPPKKRSNDIMEDEQVPEVVRYLQDNYQMYQNLGDVMIATKDWELNISAISDDKNSAETETLKGKRKGHTWRASPGER